MLRFRAPRNVALRARRQLISVPFTCVVFNTILISCITVRGAFGNKLYRILCRNSLLKCFEVTTKTGSASGGFDAASRIMGVAGFDGDPSHSVPPGTINKQLYLEVYK